MMLWEGGAIANAVLPAFKTEMRRRNSYFSVHTYTPIQDKKLRASSIQQRMRSGGVRYNTDTDWFADHQVELKKFPRGKKKDRVDAIAWLGRGIDEFIPSQTQDELDQEEWEDGYNQWLAEEGQGQEFHITGY